MKKELHHSPFHLRPQCWNILKWKERVHHSIRCYLPQTGNVYFSLILEFQDLHHLPLIPTYPICLLVWISQVQPSPLPMQSSLHYNQQQGDHLTIWPLHQATAAYDITHWSIFGEVDLYASDLNMVKNRLKYLRLDSHGPRLGEITKECTFVSSPLQTYWYLTIH